LVLAGGLFASSANAAEVLKVNLMLSKESELGQSVEFLAQRVNELTNGELQIEPFYSGALGKNIPVILQSLIAGDMDGFIESGNYLGSLDKRFNVLDAPYAFKNRAHFRAFLASAEFQSMAESIYGSGIKLVNSDKMNFFRAEDRAILATSPIFTPEDLAKLKVRQYQAEMPIRALMALGANVQVIPWPDVYAALATGTVDGVETVLSQSIATKHVEIATYLTILKLYYQTAYVMISRERWDALSPELQQALSQAVSEAGDLYTTLSAALRDSAIEDGGANYGVTVIIPPIGPFQALMEPAHAEWIAAGMLPAETMEIIKTLEY